VPRHFFRLLLGFIDFTIEKIQQEFSRIQSEKAKLQAEKEILLYNISILFQTAKEEIKRKDFLIGKFNSDLF
jgi:hypothetical protein